MSHGYLGS